MQEDTSLTELASRPAKRRKFYRQRDNSDNTFEANSVTPLSISGISAETPSTLEELVEQARNSTDAVHKDEEDAERRLPVAEILRRRRATRNRRGGIEFSNVGHGTKLSSGSTQYTDALALVDKDDTVADVKTVVNRFAPQIGQVADVDKHMMAYIDSELAKRRQGYDTSSLTQNGRSLGIDGATADLLGHNRQPAALGKLLEIDLGPDATRNNIVRTEAAKRRLEGGQVESEEGAQKPRLRKDGKPWRGRRRRNSEDIKRDKLVEEVLRESRLEIYDEPETEPANDDQAADDRIAEQFRKEFMDAITSRRQRKGPATSSKLVGGAKVDDRPKGPKLGGSRSARAAMREQQEKAAKK